MPRRKPGTARRDWDAIVAAADQIARSYSTPVTLRQLHYRLVASGVGNYINTVSCYQILSKHTSKLRRLGEFRALADTTRGVERPFSFAGPDAALRWVAENYRRDRTEGQRFQVWLIFEKATLSAQVSAWADDYGIPCAALRGYSSESLEREVCDEMTDDGRAVVAFYIGDLDPEGEDIERNFRVQADARGIEFEGWERLAVLPAQVGSLGLVPKLGKPGSTRAEGFRAKHGALFQVEVEAVDPGVLERMVSDAITDPALFDEKRWKASKAKEKREAKALRVRAEPSKRGSERVTFGEDGAPRKPRLKRL